MMRCIELAQKGKGYVSPNPLVGCVIVKNGKVISEGYHEKFGGLHAEANAIENAQKKKISLKGSTLHVNLEPCVHYGKTSPCVDKIIECGIGEVIIGCKDPNPLVSGKGIIKLKQHGVKVTSGFLEFECEALNKFFFKHIKTGIPYITLKAAQTLDGKIADDKFRSKWISGNESRTVVHVLRSEYDAVLVGRNTVEHDNPQLTVRHVKGRNPFRVVIDSSLSLSLNKKVFTDKMRSRTIVLTSEGANEKKAKELEKREIKVIRCKTNTHKPVVGVVTNDMKEVIDLKYALLKLGKLGISSVLVEGGAATYSEFLNQNMVDEILLFTSPKIMGKGISTFGNVRPIDFRNARELYYQIVGRDILTSMKV